MVMKTVSLVLLVLFAFAAPALSAPVTYFAVLTGPNEFPPNASPATGNALVTIDLVAHTLEVSANFTGLLANTTAAHIHCCTLPNAGVIVPGAPSFPGFPLGVTSGTFNNTFDTLATTTYRAAFITANGGTAAGAEAGLAAALASGNAYFNIHTSAFPGGEIRGFLQAVPEPATFAMLGAGLAGLVAIGRKRRII